MKKRLIIGDVHGLTDVVMSVYKKEKPDEVICMGDLYDPYDEYDDIIGDLYENIEGIFDLQDNHNKIFGDDTFIMLMGNHDYHYLPNIEDKYSRYSYKTQREVGCLLNQRLNECKFKFAFIDDKNNTIYSHAGVTNSWFYNIFKGTDIHELDNSEVLDKINTFGFNLYGDNISLNGNTIWQSCIWVRPESLANDLYKDVKGNEWRQVVGHTWISKPIINGKCGNYNLHAPINVIDTHQRYYVIETLDDEGHIVNIEVKKTNNLYND